MKIEIWSDIVCPFCYIGKREFENALSQFSDADNVEIEWKSFQLAPDMPSNNNQSAYDYFAEKYSVSKDESIKAHNQVAARAKGLGLDYNFEKAITVNTAKAHQFIHFAKEHGKQDEAKEMLFKSYFTDGKNLDDLETLLELAKKLSLNQEALKKALIDEKFKDAINADINEGRKLGVRGVPFFVFDRKYAISGAQESQAFLETLEKTFNKESGQ